MSFLRYLRDDDTSIANGLKGSTPVAIGMPSWRQFFSWPASDQLQTWSPDMNRIGLGIALAGLIVLFPDAASTTANADKLVAFAVTIAAIGFFWTGITNRVPGVDAEQKWDEWYDQLRNESEEFSGMVTASFPSWVTTDQAWQDYVCAVPIPKADERPLREWGPFLNVHPDDGVRGLFKYAANFHSHSTVARYRRMAVRTYGRFGELRAAKVSGFRNWMEAEEVREGAEPLLVMLAYLEIARASATGFGGKGRAREAFWGLAEEWHGYNTLDLPKHPV